QVLAASGDYALAEEACEQLASDGRGEESSQPSEQLALLIGQAVLDERPVGASVAQLAYGAVGRIKFHNRVSGLARSLREAANANVFRGLHALEVGEVDEAEVAFRLALALWMDEAAAASGAGLDFNARPIAQGYLQWLE